LLKEGRLPDSCGRVLPDPSRVTFPWFAKPTNHGDAVLRLFRLGRRYTAYIRVATLAPTLVIAWLVSTEATRTAMAMVLGLVTAWSGVYVWAQLRQRGDWIAVVDAGILMFFAAQSPRIVPQDLLVQGKIWTIPFVTFACVAYQYHLGRILGGILTLSVHAGLAVGLLSAATPSFTVISVCWSLAVSMLARTLWTLVQRGGRLADEARSEAQKIRQRSEITRAVRAEDRALTDTLHDTAATTLLMVGLGQIHGDLRSQARSDLEVLQTFGQPSGGKLDLVPLLRACVDVFPERVRFASPPRLPLSSEVARAVADATAEAVHNAVRHSGPGQVHVAVLAAPTTVSIAITDSGIGFDPDAISPARHGIKDSILGRVQRIGGQVVIETAPGAGTSVKLEFPNG